MKILATIIIAPHMSYSGAVNAALALSKSIAEFCDIDIALMSLEDGIENIGKAKLLKCKAYNPLSFTKNFLPNKFRTLLFRSHIPQMIEKGDYDIVHIHNPIPTLEMSRIAKICVKNNVPYIVSTHGFFEVTSGGDAYQLKYFYEKMAWKYLIQKPLKYVCDNASYIYALSPFEDDLLTNFLQIPSEKIKIVTNGVNTNFLQLSNDAQIKETIKKYQLPEKDINSPTVCLFLGNHTANKGIDILLAAFQQMNSEFLLVVGGKKRDQIDYTRIEKQSTNKQCIIFTDMIDDEDLAPLLQYADLFVYPTLSDTLPLVILEAMASKLPILASNVGGIPYQVTSENGVLVEVGNSKKFCEALEKLIGNKNKLKSMGETSSKLVIEKFNWDASAKTAVQYYKELLAGISTVSTTQNISN